MHIICVDSNPTQGTGMCCTDDDTNLCENLQHKFIKSCVTKHKCICFLKYVFTFKISVFFNDKTQGNNFYSYLKNINQPTSIGLPILAMPIHTINIIRDLSLQQLL